MTRGAQKSQAFDQDEFDRRVNQGEDPFQVALELRGPAQSSAGRKTGLWPAIAGILLALLAIAIASYLLWQVNGLHGRIASLASGIEDLSERIAAMSATPTPAPDAELTAAKIEFRTEDLNVIAGGPDKELVFVVLSRDGQPLQNYPVTVDVVDGPGEVVSGNGATDPTDGTFRFYFRPSTATPESGETTIRVTGPDLDSSFTLTVTEPLPAGIAFTPDATKPPLSSLRPSTAGSLHFQLIGTTQTPAKHVAVGCRVDRPEFMEVTPSDTDPMYYGQVGKGEKVEVVIELTALTAATAIDSVVVTCTARAENGEGPIGQPIRIAIEGGENQVRVELDPTNIEAGVNQSATAIVRVVEEGAGGASMQDKKIVISVDPPELAIVKQAEIISDKNGEAPITVTALTTVGEGRVVAQMDGVELAEAVLMIRPVVSITAASKARTRSSPEAGPTDTANFVTTVAKDRPYAIVGKATNNGFEWWQMRLPDGQTAWVAVMEGVDTDGDTTGVPVTWPAAASAPETPQESSNSIRRETPEPGKYELVVEAGTNTVDLPRVDGKQPPILVSMPAGGDIQVWNQTNRPVPPDESYVYAAVNVWVESQNAQTEGWLNLPLQDALACWTVLAGKPEDCGTLRAGTEPYPMSYDRALVSGRWVPAVLNVWVKIANIGEKL